MLERILSLEIVRVTERAAVSAARLRGRGDEKAADQAAVDAMRRELNKLPIDGTVVIGEGERDEAPMLFIGEKVGSRSGPKVDIAVDPLEGTTLCAKNMPGAIATMAMAEGGTLLNAPDVYMDKIAIGPGYPQGRRRSRRAGRGEHPQPRQGQGRQAVRDHGAAARPAAPCRRDRGACARPAPRCSLITDGDVAGVIHTADPAETGIDIYLGVGGAPEGVLAAAALRCIGGQMQCRLVLDTEEKRERAAEDGHQGPAQEAIDMEDMVRGDCLFAATGVTDGAMLRGVKFSKERDRDRDRGDALGHRHGALDQGRAPPAGEVLSGLEPRRPHPEEPCGARRLEGWLKGTDLRPSFETRAAVALLRTRALTANSSQCLGTD